MPWHSQSHEARFTYSETAVLPTPVASHSGDGRYARLLKSLARVELLILDDWGLAPLTSQQGRDLAQSTNSLSPATCVCRIVGDSRLLPGIRKCRFRSIAERLCLSGFITLAFIFVTHSRTPSSTVSCILNLDLHVLADKDEANIAVGHHSESLKVFRAMRSQSKGLPESMHGRGRVTDLVLADTRSDKSVPD
jgi:hypothetical protein